MALTFVDVDGNLETAVASGGKQWLRPFEDVADDFIFRQKYFQLASKFAATPLDEAHPELQGFYLVAEDGIQPVQQSGVNRILPDLFQNPRPANGRSRIQLLSPGVFHHQPARRRFDNLGRSGDQWRARADAGCGDRSRGK